MPAPAPKCGRTVLGPFDDNYQACDLVAVARYDYAGPPPKQVYRCTEHDGSTALALPGSGWTRTPIGEP